MDYSLARVRIVPLDAQTNSDGLLYLSYSYTEDQVRRFPEWQKTLQVHEVGSLEPSSLCTSD